MYESGQNSVINGAVGSIYEDNGEIISHATYNNRVFATASMPVPQQPLPEYVQGIITGVDQVNQIVSGVISINDTAIGVDLFAQ